MHSSLRRTLFSLAIALVLTLALPGVLSAQATSPYVRTAVVSPVPGNPTASGQNLLNKIAAITGASSSNRWLLKIEPGVYDVGTTAFQMKAWVDVEGSGRIETVIQGLGQTDQDVDLTVGVVQGASSEMRELTVTCVPTVERPECLTVANYQASPRFRRMNVTTMIDAGTGSRWGFRNTQASPIYDQVTVTVANGVNNYGIVNGFGSSPQIRRSFIKVFTADNENDGILSLDGGSATLVEDTTIQVRTGVRCHGIRDLGPGSPVTPLVLRRVDMLVDGDTSGSYGVLGGWQNLVVEHSKINARGPNGHAILVDGVTVTHSELIGSQVIAQAFSVNLGTSWLRGGGAITGFATERCAAVYTDNLTFFPSTCP